MGYRSLNKSADSVTQGRIVRALSGQRAEAFLPSEIEQGIYRYTKLAGNVYSVYRTTTKKYIGMALYDGKAFETCGRVELIEALENESKNRK